MKKQQQIRNWLKNYEHHIMTEASLLQIEGFPRLTEEFFSQFEKTGNRLQYEDAYFGRRKYLLVYALEALNLKKNGEKVSMGKLEWVLEEILNERCWALPAHVNRQSDPAWEYTLDLFAAETAQTLSEIGWIFRHELDQAVKIRLDEEVYRRVLETFGKSAKGSYGWEKDCNNWNAVCGGSVGAAAWYQKQGTENERQKQEMDGIIDRICEDLSCFLDSFSEDGACMEGLGYWEYGMSYYIMFADLLRQPGGENRELLVKDKVKKIMEFQQICYFPGGRTISFSDGDSRGKFRMGLTCYLAMEDPQVEIPDVKNAMDFGGDPCYRWNAGYRDWLWTERYLEQACVEKKEEKSDDTRWSSRILPDAQWAIFNGNNLVSVACKGGHNGEPHNHNDVGSFLYYIGDEEIISDLGAGEYTKKYFGPERYEILCNSSRGHSVPVIEGKYQCAGREYGAESFRGVNPWTVEISYKKAYAIDQSGELKRKIHFIPETGTLQIEDTFTGSREEKVIMSETLVTRQQVKVEKEGIRIGSCGWIRMTAAMRKDVWTEKVEHCAHDGSCQMVTLIHCPVQADTEGNYRSDFEITVKRNSL
jgi:hypothetical protein